MERTDFDLVIDYSQCINSYGSIPAFVPAEMLIAIERQARFEGFRTALVEVKVESFLSMR